MGLAYYIDLLTLSAQKFTKPLASVALPNTWAALTVQTLASQYLVLCLLVSSRHVAVVTLKW